LESQQDPVLPGRACGGCTLCCKVLTIQELGKPQGEWCAHCEVGRGCTIYSARPGECRDFHCGYLAWPMIREHWYPATSKMVLVSELDGTRLAIHVDPARPDAWRGKPYYDEIKQMARLAAAKMQQVMVCIRDKAIIILPDEDVDLGPIAEDERIIIGEAMVNGRSKLRAMKVHVDDPRIAGMKAGVPMALGRAVSQALSEQRKG